MMDSRCRVGCRALVLMVLVVAAFTSSASAYYHPLLGRFLTRDPGSGASSPGTAPGRAFVPLDSPGAGYQDGPNLYQYVRSNPITGLDPTGLWDITRAGKPLAKARAETGDTIEGLAIEIGLNEDEFGDWLTLTGTIRLADGTNASLATLEKTDEICLGGAVEIPNTVLAYWAGHFGDFGKWYVMWYSDVEALTERGFFVPEKEGWNADQLADYMRVGSENREMHGIFFWGHGGKGGTLLTDADHRGEAEYFLPYSKLAPIYELGFGSIFACYSQTATVAFSKNSVFWGAEGVLVPWPFHWFGPSIADQLPPGAQGTRD